MSGQVVSTRPGIFILFSLSLQDLWTIVNVCSGNKWFWLWFKWILGFGVVHRRFCYPCRGDANDEIWENLYRCGFSSFSMPMAKTPWQKRYRTGSLLYALYACRWETTPENASKNSESTTYMRISPILCTTFFRLFLLLSGAVLSLDNILHGSTPFGLGLFGVKRFKRNKINE